MRNIQDTNPPERLEIRCSSGIAIRFTILAAFVYLVFSASASVQVTKLEPPRLIGSWDLEDEQSLALGIGLVAVDFNFDGRVDARIAYGWGGASFYFDYPTRIVIARTIYPWTTNVYGDVGPLPLGTVIGSNLVTTLNTNIYIWHVGDTNRFPDPSVTYLGDHKSIMFGFLAVDFDTVVYGDMAGKEAVIAVEFLIGTNKHYGYIHCDFRKETGYGPPGTGGYILGWAYETEADTPIVAAPIAISPAPFKCSIQPRGSGLLDIIWNATPGATFRLQGTPSLDAQFTNVTPEFVILTGSSAASVVQILTIEAPASAPVYFWRVMRTR